MNREQLQRRLADYRRRVKDRDAIISRLTRELGKMGERLEYAERQLDIALATRNPKAYGLDASYPG